MSDPVKEKPEPEKKNTLYGEVLTKDNAVEALKLVGETLNAKGGECNKFLFRHPLTGGQVIVLLGIIVWQLCSKGDGISSWSDLKGEIGTLLLSVSGIVIAILSLTSRLSEFLGKETDELINKKNEEIFGVKINDILSPINKKQDQLKYDEITKNTEVVHFNNEIIAVVSIADSPNFEKLSRSTNNNVSETSGADIKKPSSKSLKSKAKKSKNIIRSSSPTETTLEVDITALAVKFRYSRAGMANDLIDWVIARSISIYEQHFNLKFDIVKGGQISKNLPTQKLSTNSPLINLNGNETKTILNKKNSKPIVSIFMECYSFEKNLQDVLISKNFNLIDTKKLDKKLLIGKLYGVHKKIFKLDIFINDIKSNV